VEPQGEKTKDEGQETSQTGGKSCIGRMCCENVGVLSNAGQRRGKVSAGREAGATETAEDERNPQHDYKIKEREITKRGGKKPPSPIKISKRGSINQHGATSLKGGSKKGAQRARTSASSTRRPSCEEGFGVTYSWGGSQSCIETCNTPQNIWGKKERTAAEPRIHGG